MLDPVKFSQLVYIWLKKWPRRFPVALGHPREPCTKDIAETRRHGTHQPLSCDQEHILGMRYYHVPHGCTLMTFIVVVCMFESLKNSPLCLLIWSQGGQGVKGCVCCFCSVCSSGSVLRPHFESKLCKVVQGDSMLKAPWSRTYLWFVNPVIDVVVCTTQIFFNPLHGGLAAPSIRQIENG